MTYKAMQHTITLLIFFSAACTTPNPNYHRDSAPQSDADVHCEAPKTACGGACVDTATSEDNCGACGRSCGGGTCSASVCSPATLWASIDQPNDFAIDATSVYVTYEDKVASCPLVGCAGKQPNQIASMSPSLHYPTGIIQVSNSRLYFVGSPDQTTERYFIYTCPVAGCPVTVPTVTETNFSPPSAMTVIGDTVTYVDVDAGLYQVTCTQGVCATPIYITPKPLSGVAVDDNFIYTVDRSTTSSTSLALVKCPIGQGNCTRTVITADGRYTAQSELYNQLIVHSGIIYVNGTGRISGGNGIYQCPVGGCPKPTEFQSTFGSIPDVKVDDSGIYWIDGTMGGEIHTCPLSGCATGVKKVYTAPSTASIKRLWLDQSFVYWMELTPNGSGMNGTIYRIAK